MTVHRQRRQCRVCSGSQLRPFLSLGPTPLANAFLRSPAEFADEPSFPLDLYFCEQCSLVQLVDVISPEVLFRDYIYVTGTSETIAAHNGEYARTLVDLLRLGPADLVIEIASNDGSLLKCFRSHGVRTLGIEPATNIARKAEAEGVETVNEFFSRALARQVRQTHGPAAVVVGNNVLAHVDETQDFLRGCKELLAEDGVVVIEVPYLRELIERLEYDTVYHEHLCYFSAGALVRLFEAAELGIFRIDRVAVHGGSLRVYAGRREKHPLHAADVLALVEQEKRLGLARFECYRDFAAAVEANRRALRGLLTGLKKQGKTIAGYGAPAKGNTLLNFCGIDTGLLAFTVDRNPWKVGRWTPGMHIPVRPVSALLERQPDCVLILPWNLADEIMAQQSEYHARGGRFILPVPEPRIV